MSLPLSQLQREQAFSEFTQLQGYWDRIHESERLLDLAVAELRQNLPRFRPFSENILRAIPEGSPFTLSDYQAAAGRALFSPSFAGQGGASRWAVLGAHLSIALTAGSSRHWASARQVAIRARTCLDTASRAHEHLVRDGWLLFLEGARDGKGTRWQLGPRCFAGDWQPFPDYHGQDLWRWGSLGHSLERLYTALLTREDWTEVELVAAFGGSVRNLRYHLLPKLQFHGLASRDSQTWRATKLSPDDWSRLDTFERTRAQKMRYEEESRAFKNYRARRAPKPINVDVETGEILSA